VTRLRLCLVVGAALFLGLLTGASHATTTPGVLSVAKLVIRDDKVVFVGDEFMTKMGFPHYPRGSDVRYDVRNLGTRPYSLNILGSVTGTIAPREQRSILVYWGRRGKFTFRVRPNGPVLRIWVI
jgi:hypothetical protein